MACVLAVARYGGIATVAALAVLLAMGLAASPNDVQPAEGESRVDKAALSAARLCPMASMASDVASFAFTKAQQTVASNALEAPPPPPSPPPEGADDDDGWTSLTLMTRGGGGV